MKYLLLANPNQEGLTMNQTTTEQFNAYRFDKNGTCDYSSKTEIVYSNDKELHTKIMDFIANNIDKAHELRIVDSEDIIVFQVKDNELVFPLVGKMKQGNRWFPELRAFVNPEDFATAEADALIKRVNKTS